MTAAIEVVKVIGPGLVAISYNGDEALWARCRVRKETTCAMTGARIGRSAWAYRPVGNQGYRMVRIAAAAIDPPSAFGP